MGVMVGKKSNVISLGSVNIPFLQRTPYTVVPKIGIHFLYPGLEVDSYSSIGSLSLFSKHRHHSLSTRAFFKIILEFK